MPRGRSTRPSEGGSQKSPNPKQKVGIRRTRGKTKRARSTKSESLNGVVDTDDDGARDLIDVIDSNEAQRASTEEEVYAEGAHDEDEERLSVSSIASGPSFPHDTTNNSLKSSLTMCSVCSKLHQKAKRMKKPMKDKLLDNGECTGCVV